MPQITLWWLLPVTQWFGIAEGLPPGAPLTAGGAIPAAMMTEPSPPSTAFYNAMMDKRTSRGGITATAHRISVIMPLYTVYVRHKSIYKTELALVG